ncbi:putative cyclin [Helianthus annuus]|nr:putative cyclin [Helianthus annuus]
MMFLYICHTRLDLRTTFNMIKCFLSLFSPFISYAKPPNQWKSRQTSRESAYSDLFLLLMLETSIMNWRKSNMSKTSTNSTNLPESSRSRNKKPQSSLTSTLTARSKAACGLNYKPKNIVDIDAGDVDNELAQGEYVEVIYKFYKLVEPQLAASALQESTSQS